MWKFVTAALLSLLYIPSSYACISPETAYGLYAVAYGQYGSRHGGVPLPDKAPEIECVSPEKLAEVWGCATTDECRGLLAITDSGTPREPKPTKIWLSNTMNYDQDPFARTIVVHEMIHFFQQNHLGLSLNCYQWVQYEREAYMIQIYLMNQAGLDTISIQYTMRMLPRMCADPVAPAVAL